MPKAKVLQSTFTTGVLAPTLEGRVDIAKYYNSLTIGNNITLMPHGGAKRRAGTRPVLKSTDSSLGYAAQELYFTNEVRFEPFVFNIDQKYLIVIDTEHIHIIKDKLLLHSFGTATQLGSAFSSAFSSSFGTTTPAFTAAQLKEMDVTQYADTMIIVHPDFKPFKLIRGVTELDWTLEAITFTNIPLYDYTNQYLGIREIFKGNGTEVKFILIYTTPNFAVYVDGVKYNGTGYAYDKEVGKITFTTAPANGANIELVSGAGVPAMNADNTYEDIWSDARGYPKSVTIFQGRLYFGGTKSKPITVMGSVINDYFNFNLGDGAADMGIFDTLSSGVFDDIVNITSARSLQVITESGEYFNPANPITPATSAWKRQTGYGGYRTGTVSIDGATYFVDASRAAVRQFVYSLDEDAYVSPNVSILSDHLVNDIERMVVQRGTGSNIANLVYVLNADGTMAVLNTMRLEEIQGWSRWTTQGLYRDICVVDDDLYMLIARGYEEGTDTIKYYIELSDEDVLLDHYHTQGEGFDKFRGDTVTKKFYLENSTDGNFEVRLDNISAVPQPTYAAVDNSISFLTAPDDDVKILVMPTAGVYADMVLPTSASIGFRELSKRGDLYYEGSAIPVKDGAQLKLSFEKYHSYLEAGFNFKVHMRTVNLNLATQEGQLVNRTKRLVKVKVNLYKTLGIKISHYTVADKKFIMQFNEHIVPFTGLREVHLLGYAEHNAVEITQDIPMPFTILQIETEIKF